MIKQNRVKKTLSEGGICFGTMLRILKVPHAYSLCAAEGWDYIILDTEHNDYDLETISNFALAARYGEMGFFVRVPDKHYFQMAQMLDIGAEGLVLPQVCSGSESKKIIEAVKYSPEGRRGVSISQTLTLFKDMDQAEYTRLVNNETMVVVQIESEAAVQEAQNIVSVPGIDAVMIGPADLSQDMGIPGQFDHPRMVAALGEVIQQCNKYGVAPGIHLPDMKYVEQWIRQGMRLITYSYDIKLLRDASRDALSGLKEICGKI